MRALSSAPMELMLATLLVVAAAGCHGAALPSVPPSPSPPSRLSSRTERPLSELEAREDCAWRQLPMWLYFDCGDASLESVSALSLDPWLETVQYIDSQPDIVGVQAFGFHRYDEEAPLARARARAVASALRQRFGVAARARSMGAGRDEGCRCGEPCYSRTAQVAVLRCREPGSDPPASTAADTNPTL